MDAVPDYYSSSLHMPLKNLAHMPKKFYLDLAGADEIMVSFGHADDPIEQSTVGFEFLQNFKNSSHVRGYLHYKIRMYGAT